MTPTENLNIFEVSTIEIAGLVGALQALRLPFGKECRSYTFSQKETFSPAVEMSELKLGDYYDGIRFTSTITLHSKDKQLIQTLVKRGDEHAKVLRGVMVWCKINAPRYWWQEMDTYRVGAERLSSESTMHIEGKGMPEEELIKMKESLTEGHMQKRVWMFSYQTLRRIYFQRKDHRLPQWRMFCAWIETLPFAKEFITVEND